ncbi:hypothetical protein [Pseudonocardia sp. H11422]|uniref:hypothetical protein n=1 Tax=Pseudonocardia sp. H11422 TaxID=2835866 RepID=UPI001BDBE258|nr:hypothetical protein [Pseudonocardia sp. H11422]
MAQRIDSVLPGGFDSLAEGGRVEIFRDGLLIGSSAAPEIVDSAPDSHAQIETATRAALSSVQDLVSETLTEPWPEGLPAAGARVVGSELRLWFGDEAAPVVELTAISVDDL